MKVIIYIAIFIILCPIFSCKENEPKNDSFFFYVPGSDIGITTSKRPGNLFYVVFAEDSVQPSDSVDYIKYKIDVSTNLYFAFDPRNKKAIYVLDSDKIIETNILNDSLKILQDDEFMTLVADTGILATPESVLKYPYVEVWIYPSDYTIFTTEYEPVHKCIKEGKTYITW